MGEGRKWLLLLIVGINCPYIAKGPNATIKINEWGESKKGVLLSLNLCKSIIFYSLTGCARKEKTVKT
jgi:hypothetical protein